VSFPIYLNYNISGSGIDKTLTLRNSLGDFVLYGRQPQTESLFKIRYSYSTETANGIIYPSPLDNTTLIVSPFENEFPEFDDSEIMGHGNCNAYCALQDIYILNETEFNMPLFTQTFVECDDNFYEPTYLSIISNEANGPFSYDIQDDGNTLILTNAMGEVLTFGEQAPPANIIGQWYL
jgi:hypothetical protein